MLKHLKTGKLYMIKKTIRTAGGQIRRNEFIIFIKLDKKETLSLATVLHKGKIIKIGWMQPDCENESILSGSEEIS